jgi:hypothetical protein
VIKEALQWVAERVIAGEQVQEIDYNGVHYINKTMIPMGEDFRPSAVNVTTLNGLVDLIPEMTLADSNQVILIADQSMVWFGEANPDAFGTRLGHICAKLEAITLPIGRYLDPETFIIWFQSCFQTCGDFGYVLELVSHLTAERVVSAVDDGITQRAGQSRGVVRKENVLVRPRVRLAPYRTFREIDPQPESEFLLRLKNEGEDQPPSVALFEADGGAWKLEARQRIAEYLAGKLKESDQTIPVVC